MVRQLARWSTAANQDNNALNVVLHANYGVGYLLALKDIATISQIKAGTGFDLLKFEGEIIKTQYAATMNMANLCPKYAPKKNT